DAVAATLVARTAAVDGVPWESALVADRGGQPVGWARTVTWAEEAQVFVLPGAAPDLEVAEQLLAHALLVAQRAADTLRRPLAVLAADQPGTPWSRAVHRAGRRRPEPSGYYARIADPVALLRALVPVLSRRLADSGLADDHGELV